MTNEIHCHDSEPRYGGLPIRWRDPEPAVREDGYEGRWWRTCSYCGCIHPDDLKAFLKEGARLGGSDWKYGWPHKFYVYDIPNPNEGNPIRIGTKTHDENGNCVEGGIPMIGKATAGTGKWYNTHLQDLSDDDFNELAAILHEKTGIGFTRDSENKMSYNAPYAGYQK